jgi:hypothetical protein
VVTIVALGVIFPVAFVALAVIWWAFLVVLARLVG